MKRTTGIKRSVLFSGFVGLVFVGCNIMFTGPSVSQTLTGDVAIKGYDSVSYFKEGRAVKGDKAFAFQWHGANWYFSNKENRDLFAATPEKYAPQYGGYCAWAMSTGRKAHTDPEVWKIVDGKLYLNCSREAFRKWEADIPGNILKADANWRSLADKN
jgi:YHS domain-containing protein